MLLSGVRIEVRLLLSSMASRDLDINNYFPTHPTQSMRSIKNLRCQWPRPGIFYWRPSQPEQARRSPLGAWNWIRTRIERFWWALYYIPYICSIRRKVYFLVGLGLITQQIILSNFSYLTLFFGDSPVALLGPNPPYASRPGIKTCWRFWLWLEEVWVKGKIKK